MLTHSTPALDAAHNFQLTGFELLSTVGAEPYEQGVIDYIACRYKSAHAYFMHAAELGHPGAMMYLYIMYNSEQLGERDQNLMEFWRVRVVSHIAWFFIGASAQIANVQNLLGYAYESGLITDIGGQQAFRWYQESALQNYVEGQYRLALCYESERGVNQNKVYAFRWYEQAANQDYALAQYALACCYAEGRGVEENMSQAMYWFGKASDNGLAEAQYRFADCYSTGIVRGQNISWAIYWYKKAADQGHFKAQVDLVCCYEKQYKLNSQCGSVFDHDINTDWDKQTAQQSLAEAQFALANRYVLEEKYSDAAFWFKKAVDNGLVDARLALDCDEKMFLFKNNTNPDWDKQTARQNLARVQFALANQYVVEPNDEQAAFWFQKAADNNLAEAQYMVALWYEGGRYFERSYDGAVSWYKRAAFQQHQMAQTNLAKLLKMSRISFESGDINSCAWNGTAKGADLFLAQDGDSDPWTA